MYYQTLRKQKKWELVRPSQHAVTDRVVAWDSEILYFAFTHTETHRS